MKDQLIEAGTAEKYKAGCHLLLFGIAAVCAAYNGLALSQRHERHLLTNTILYSALSVFEISQLARHWEAR